MISPCKFKATNNDLPEIFFAGKSPPKKEHRPTPREIKLALHYPVMEWRNEKQIQLERKLEEKANRPDNSDRRIYVKGKKVGVMNGWLEAIEIQKPKMNDWESKFTWELSQKFHRYFPKMKWITERQYQALKAIALKYLRIPQ